MANKNIEYRIKWANGDGGPNAGGSVGIPASGENDALRRFRDWRANNQPYQGWKRSAWVVKIADGVEIEVQPAQPKEAQ